MYYICLTISPIHSACLSQQPWGFGPVTQLPVSYFLCKCGQIAACQTQVKLSAVSPPVNLAVLAFPSKRSGNPLLLWHKRWQSSLKPLTHNCQLSSVQRSQLFPLSRSVSLFAVSSRETRMRRRSFTVHDLCVFWGVSRWVCHLFVSRRCFPNIIILE